jgi:DnaJ-class molecular chaperone
LSNEKRRAYYDKHGYTEEDAENEGTGFSGMDDLFEAMFSGKGGGFGFNMDMGAGGDDFEEFINIMEGNDTRSFKNMF